ncbi:hypothetical protein EW026_g8379 [Hermanssonia centrifuga]|uniref:Uncharacterized protein n=1 Tax=Hermanssonia centrifuga TaxID=98765 RepID=A0A4S4K8N4_9APHY|nr:hypothetical protein EW026_g8379 [Hermanssonia centrifuga]
MNPYGVWCETLLDEDEDFVNELNVHLQSCGKYVRALDIVHYLDQADVKERYGLEKTVSLATAKRWMNRLGYRWSRTHKGQYVDGHEREDVVNYRTKVFLPVWEKIEAGQRSWDNDGKEIIDESRSHTERPVVVWYHDESTFYAHDQRQSRWVREGEAPTPYAKGEGHSLMVADFVSADYGEQVVAQAQQALAILQQDYPNEDHILVYDNATTHLKRADDALSARSMPKNPPKEGSNWFVEVTERDKKGMPSYTADGKVRKKKVQMAPGKFADGTQQDFYFGEGHARAGIFKGMANILTERGHNVTGLRAECKGFRCNSSAGPCCCRRMLYNEPDFANVKSVLELTCQSQGVRVIFLPKFHCELNPIEQCWGQAKRIYRLKPFSSKEDDLERNTLDALDSVELAQIRKYGRRCLRFMDAYRKGLDGVLAAWVVKIFHGHRVIPDAVLKALEDIDM